MSRKHFSSLLVATLVAVLAVALLLPGQTGREEAVDGDATLLPGLAGWVNDAARVEVAGAGEGDGVTLVRGDAGWAVEELSGYPADFDGLRTLLAGLARAEVTEWKTDNPAYYDRLGVQDLDADGATGVLVTVSDGEGARSASVILGDTPQGRNGVFARVAGQPRSALVDEDLDASARPTDWVDRDLLDLPAAEVAEVAVTHPDGETVTVRKVAADDADYTLVELPEGRSPKSAWTVNSIANAFAALRFDDVRPAGDIDWGEALAVDVLTFDGRAYALELVTAEDGVHWMRANASVYETGAAAPGDGAGESAAPTGDADATAGGDEKAADEGVVEDATADAGADARGRVAERIADEDARFEGWAFAVPGYKYDPLNKRLDDLLAEPEGAADETGTGQ